MSTNLREKITEALAEHEPTWQSDGDYCERTWVECRCGETWDVPTMQEEWAAAHAHQVEATLAAFRSYLASDEVVERAKDAIGECVVTISADLEAEDRADDARRAEGRAALASVIGGEGK